MEQQQVIDQIKRVGRDALPPHSTLLLYGSRARSDAHAESDWDLLILLDKPKLQSDDYDITYSFRELGWQIGEEISPHVYTKKTMGWMDVPSFPQEC